MDDCQHFDALVAELVKNAIAVKEPLANIFVAELRDDSPGVRLRTYRLSKLE